MQLLTHLYGGVAVAQLNSLMASETIDKTTIAMDGAATLRYLQIVLLPPAQIASSNSSSACHGAISNAKGGFV